MERRVSQLTMNKPMAVLEVLSCNVLKETPESKALSNFLSNLKQTITTPRRMSETCEFLIDAILVSPPDLVHALGVINSHISDHYPVYVTPKLKLHLVTFQQGVTSVMTLICSQQT